VGPPPLDALGLPGARTDSTPSAAPASSATTATAAEPPLPLPRPRLADQELELVSRRRRGDAHSCAAACPKDPTSGVTAMVVDGGSPGQ
jgi:hypothetical protein